MAGSWETTTPLCKTVFYIPMYVSVGEGYPQKLEESVRASGTAVTQIAMNCPTWRRLKTNLDPLVKQQVL